jgi:hypothetical protein
MDSISSFKLPKNKETRQGVLSVFFAGFFIWGVDGVSRRREPGLSKGF